MADDRNVYERLDSIETTGEINNRILASLLNTIRQESQKGQVQQNRLTELNERQILANFLSSSKKSLMWLGSKSEFARTKKLAVIANIILILVGIINTIASTISFQFYSPFSIFENIWLICSFVILMHLFASKYVNEFENLLLHSPEHYETDKVGMLYRTKTKLVYRFFKVLSIIAIVLNIIGIWTDIGKSLKIFATLTEFLYLGSIIFASITTSNFFLTYCIARFEGENLTTREKVVLVLPPGAKGLMTEEEFKSKMPYSIE